MPSYVSARSRAQLVDVLLAAQIALYALRVAGALFLVVAPNGELAQMLARGARLSQPFLLILFIATAIAFLFWLDRAARNLPSLGAGKAIAAEHIVGIFFAPLVNLCAIPYVVWHVWQGSDPTPPARRWLLAGWWPSLLLGALGITVTLWSAPLFLVSAMCLVGIVRDVQRRQDEQFLDDELRRAVPRPTALR
jgi:cytochrome bd-type quinol oxidase subunit 2